MFECVAMLTRVLVWDESDWTAPSLWSERQYPFAAQISYRSPSDADTSHQQTESLRCDHITRVLSLLTWVSAGVIFALYEAAFASPQPLREQHQPPYKPNGATPQHGEAARRWLLRRWKCVPSLTFNPPVLVQGISNEQNFTATTDNEYLDMRRNAQRRALRRTHDGPPPPRESGPSSGDYGDHFSLAVVLLHPVLDAEWISLTRLMGSRGSRG